MSRDVERYKWALIVLLFVLDFIVTGYVTCYLWNSIMAGMLGLRTITYWQGWALSLIINYFKQPIGNGKNKTDYADTLGQDIIYTLIVAGLMFLLIHVAGI